MPSGGRNCGGVKGKHNLEVRGGESHLGRPWGVFFPRDGVILFHCQMSYYMGLCPYSDPEQKSLSGMQLPDYNFQILPFDVFELKRWKITVFHFIFFDFLYQPNMAPGGLDPCRVYVYKQRAFTDLYARNACRLKLNFRFCFWDPFTLFRRQRETSQNPLHRSETWEYIFIARQFYPAPRIQNKRDQHDNLSI